MSAPFAQAGNIHIHLSANPDHIFIEA